jgi:hypothetical protein
MSRQRNHQRRSLPRSASARILSTALLCVLTGAVLPIASGDNSISGFDELTLAPGDTGHCDSSPCTVYLKMPEGSGTYEVTSNSDGRIGEYPAGETVKLGSFWNSQAFTVEGADVRKAYLYIGGM